jgi:hypothetical protein
MTFFIRCIGSLQSSPNNPYIMILSCILARYINVSFVLLAFTSQSTSTSAPNADCFHLRCLCPTPLPQPDINSADQKLMGCIQRPAYSEQCCQSVAHDPTTRTLQIIDLAAESQQSSTWPVNRILSQLDQLSVAPLPQFQVLSRGCFLLRSRILRLTTVEIRRADHTTPLYPQKLALNFADK